MKHLKNLPLFCILHFALCTVGFAAEENPILRAMASELGRSMGKLQLEGQGKPYFISYRVTDYATVAVEGYLGSITESSGSRFRNLIVDVRVGSYELDNSGVDRQRGDFNEEDWRYRNIRVPVENDTVSIKQRLWLATDQAYKKALEDFANKKKNLALNPDTEARPNDFSREKPEVSIGDEVTLSVNKKEWEERVKRYSLIFKAYPEVQLSRVRFDAGAATRYFVTSEGSNIQDGAVRYWFEISGETRSGDGMPLRGSRQLTSYDGSWSDELVEREIRQLAEGLTKLKDAPACDAYAGPVLVQASAGASLFAAVLAPLFEGDKKRWKDEEGLENKVGERILPASVSIFDDPTIKEYKGEVVTGFYRFDEEGVPAQRVSLVENGVLKNFLLSRSPVKGFPTSNGHGRANLWEKPRADIGNLIVESQAPAPFSQLKKQLIGECKRQGKPYGLLITELQFPAVVEVYKVYTDGKEELVRGAELVSGSPFATLGKIIGLGNDPKAVVASRGSVVTPSLLFSELEIRKIKKGIHPPPILPPPTE